MQTPAQKSGVQNKVNRLNKILSDVRTEINLLKADFEKIATASFADDQDKKEAITVIAAKISLCQNREQLTLNELNHLPQ